MHTYQKSMTRTVFLFCLVSLTLTAGAQKVQKVKRKGVDPIPVRNPSKAPQFSLEQMQGRWQEIKRIPANGQDGISFNDTLQIRIEGKKAEVKDATSMQIGMKGEAQIEEGNTLTVAADVFTILSVDSNSLRLNDGEFTRVLVKKEKYYTETVGKQTIEQEKYEEAISIDLRTNAGRWIIYRRQAEAGIRSDELALLKSFEINDFLSDNKGSGTVVFYNSDKTETLPCTFIFSDGSLTMDTEKHVWVFTTYKGDGKELVFGEKGKFLYYAKH